jgi:hypothetical protein
VLAGDSLPKCFGQSPTSTMIILVLALRLRVAKQHVDINIYTPVACLAMFTRLYFGLRWRRVVKIAFITSS